MPRYKRSATEAELDVPVQPEVASDHRDTLIGLRNMWEFASLMQYIYLFGHVVKIDEDLDIEDLEQECLKPAPSETLPQIGLQLLKYVSSHRGLTPDIFDEYTRRQYLAKAPQRNPFGDEEDPSKFNDLDVFTRIQVLQQLSTWTFGNAERIRGLMPMDEDHLGWRMEPLGWDKDDRAYFVLDDNRLYRRTDEPLPPPIPQPKSKSKAKSKPPRASRSRATRASKRRKVEDTDDDEVEEQTEVDETMVDETELATGENMSQETPHYGFTSKTWECVAITLDEYQDFMAGLFRSRDPNEKTLRSRIEEEVLPVIEKRAEALKQKQMRKLRELENLQKMATAKRSSRLAGKAEKERQDREEREAEDKKQAEIKMAHEEQERQRRIVEGHESRRLTREQRVREREAKRILHEEELARLEELGEEAAVEEGDTAEAKRISERQRITQQEQHKRELEKLNEDEGNWYFDCSVCGKHGENMDDGTHSIACDRCEVWQHSKCHGFSPKQAESEDFSFICVTCKRKEEDAKKPRIPTLKLVNRASPEAYKVEAHGSASRPSTANGALPEHLARQLDNLPNDQAQPKAGPFGQLTTGAAVSQTQASGYPYPPVGNFAPQAPPQQSWQGGPNTPQGHLPGYRPPPVVNGYTAHQQQHHYAHHNAVTSAGGHPHPSYQQPYTPHNGYTQRISAGMYPQGNSAQHPYPTQQSYQQQHQQLPQHQPHQRQESAPSVNGFQSPKPHSSPPQQAFRYQSPRTNLPAPSASPAKASPPPPLYQQQNSHPSPQPPHLAQTPQQTQSSTSNGHHDHQFQTPQANGPRSARDVAADGMSGPWPENTHTVPQKYDQSPVPPPSSQNIGENKIFPPTSLVPSPSREAVAGSASVPTKKMSPQANGQPPS